ncbi:MAG: hypothetical protein U1E05_22240 [Patescibacteria group bacterium]|nr:hypothetical protein [Patescibacteria group bacterium]
MQRPTSVTVFGILNIVFGVLGILGTLFALSVRGSQSNPFLPEHPVVSAWMTVGVPLGFAFAIMQIVAGIGMLLLRRWGRICAIVHAIYAIVSTLAGAVISAVFVFKPLLDQMDADQNPALRAGIIGGIIGSALGSVIGCIYPALLWYFMNRPHVRAAFAGTWTGPDSVDAESESDELPPIMDIPASNNPYASPLAGSRQAGDAISAIDTMIPSRNGAALASYYLGLFSLFPLLGFPLAIAAIVLGVKGLRNVSKEPAVRGKIHSWVGLICGGVFGLFNFVLIGVLIVGIIAASRR